MKKGEFERFPLESPHNNDQKYSRFSLRLIFLALEVILVKNVLFVAIISAQLKAQRGDTYEIT